MKKTLLILPAVLLLAAACNSGSAPDQNQQPPEQTQSSQNHSGGSTFENDYMKFTVPAGWNVSVVKNNPGSAVNITKGKYILYITTQAQQASGVIGGRFAEIAMGAPSADAVVTAQPSGPCGTSEKHSLPDQSLMPGHPRVDLYVSKTSSTDGGVCHLPSIGATVWYFSYISSPGGGYFNYYNPTAAGSGKAFVITMAYNSKDVNTFPQKGSAELNAALGDMSAIVQGLVIKKH